MSGEPGNAGRASAKNPATEAAAVPSLPGSLLFRVGTRHTHIRGTHMTTQPQTGEGTPSVTCRACGHRFNYRADYYQKRLLRPPTSCPACRLQREQRLLTVHATIERTNGRFIFAKAADGARYFVGPQTIAADVGDLRVGDAITFDVDPAATVEPGRKPRALRVRRCEALEGTGEAG